MHSTSVVAFLKSWLPYIPSLWSCAWPSADKLLPRARAVFGHSYACIPILPRRVYLQSQCWQCQAIFQYVISSPIMMHSSRVRKSAELHGNSSLYVQKLHAKKPLVVHNSLTIIDVFVLSYFGNGHMRPKYHIWHNWPLECVTCIFFGYLCCFRQGFIRVTLRNKKNVGLIWFMSISSSDFWLLCCTNYTLQLQGENGQNKPENPQNWNMAKIAPKSDKFTK